jgi:hypothetical protein
MAEHLASLVGKGEAVAGGHRRESERRRATLLPGKLFAGDQVHRSVVDGIGTLA